MHAICQNDIWPMNGPSSKHTLCSWSLTVSCIETACIDSNMCAIAALPEDPWVLLEKTSPRWCCALLQVNAILQHVSEPLVSLCIGELTRSLHPHPRKLAPSGEAVKWMPVPQFDRPLPVQAHAFQLHDAAAHMLLGIQLT